MKDPLPALLAEADLVFFAGEDLDDLVLFAAEEIVVLFFLGGGTGVAEEVLVLLFLRGGGAAVVASMLVLLFLRGGVAEKVLVLLFLEADVVPGAATDVEATLFLDLQAVCVDSFVVGGAVGAGAEAAGTLGGLCAVAAIEEPASE
jgi:hypothetical protein